MKRILLLLLALPLFAFIHAGCENNSNAQQETVEIEALAVDFLQNIISGSVGEQISDNEYILELELSPNTAYMSDLPLRTRGSMTTERFYENFNINFPQEFPNAILSINEVGTPSALAFEMKNPVYDPETNTLEVIVSVLDVISDAGNQAINMINVDELISPFGQSSLFIDDATNTCSGLQQGKCSTGNSQGAECGDETCCFIDGQCEDLGATCVGGSAGTCSVSEQDCLDNLCCTSGLGCLDVIPLPL